MLLIGVAPLGGALPPGWRGASRTRSAAGPNVEAGLHTVLGEDAGARPGPAAAARRGAARPAGQPRPTSTCRAAPRSATRRLRVVHTVGSDCAIGKMSVVLELDRAARERGQERSVFVATGQTGIAISGWGIAVDHVISDYTAGAAERLVAGGCRARRHCCSSRARAPCCTRPTRASRWGCCTARCPTCWCWPTRPADWIRRVRGGAAAAAVRAVVDAVRARKQLEPIRPAPREAAIALNTLGLDDDGRPRGHRRRRGRDRAARGRRRGALRPGAAARRTHLSGPRRQRVIVREYPFGNGPSRTLSHGRVGACVGAAPLCSPTVNFARAPPCSGRCHSQRNDHG